MLIKSDGSGIQVNQAAVEMGRLQIRIFVFGCLKRHISARHHY